MTLEQIAVLAGVSRATVSRVINDQPRVSDRTRARVRAIVSQQDYHPNIAARALAGRRSQTVGVVIPATMYASIAAPYYALVLQGVAAACDERGYNLMLSPGKAQTPESYERIIQSGFVDGLVVSTSSVGEPFLRWLHERAFPFVLLGHQPNLPDLNTVTADNEGGAAMAAQHLMWLGYERIAMITGNHAHGAAMDRRAGFLNALREARMHCPDEYIVESDFSEHGGHLAMQILLATQPRPQAVFCSSDMTAIGACQAVREAGLCIPDDIAIVGYDDIPMARTVDPPLTTVRQPIEEIGYTATSTLIDILETQLAHPGRSLSPQHLMLPTELVVRESCGQKRRFQSNRPAVGGRVTVP